MIQSVAQAGTALMEAEHGPQAGGTMDWASTALLPMRAASTDDFMVGKRGADDD